MSKKQFTLDSWLKDKSQKVVTRCGFPVRIVCTDVKRKDYPILALVERDDQEEYQSFTKDGRFSLYNPLHDNFDLFIETADEVSEGEKVREGIIELVKQSSEILNKKNQERMLAWLEKQGEKHPNPYNGISFEYNGHIWGMCARDNGVDISCDKHLIKHLEKQSEQKPNGGIVREDFTQGDGWYKVNLDYLSKAQVEEIEQLVEKWNPKEVSEDEKIKKAILIYLDWLDGKKDYLPKGDYTIKDMILWLEKQGEGIDYANKEYWRGYREGKKLILDKYAEVKKQSEQKFEMKTAEESLGIDSDTYNKIVDECLFGEQKLTEFERELFDMLTDISKPRTADCVKSHSEKLLSIARKMIALEQKPEENKGNIGGISANWSEEDEVKINRIVACLENLNVADNDILLKDVAWLKSIRPHDTWKPSDGDIIILEKVIKGELEPKVFQATLFNVLEQLKKLKEGKV